MRRPYSRTVFCGADSQAVRLPGLPESAPSRVQAGRANGGVPAAGFSCPSRIGATTGGRLTGDRLTGATTGGRLTGGRLTGDRLTGDRLTGDRLQSSTGQSSFVCAPHGSRAKMRLTIGSKYSRGRVS